MPSYVQFNKHTHTHIHTHTLTALVPMDNVQASFQILCLSSVSRLSHLIRTAPPSITQEASRHFDVLIVWALASIIAGDGAAVAGLPTSEEVANDPNVCRKQTFLGRKALRQVHLPIRERGLGIISSDAMLALVV